MNRDFKITGHRDNQDRLLDVAIDKAIKWMNPEECKKKVKGKKKTIERTPFYSRLCSFSETVSGVRTPMRHKDKVDRAFQELTPQNLSVQEFLSTQVKPLVFCLKLRHPGYSFDYVGKQKLRRGLRDQRAAAFIEGERFVETPDVTFEQLCAVAVNFERLAIVDSPQFLECFKGRDAVYVRLERRGFLAAVDTSSGVSTASKHVLELLGATVVPRRPSRVAFQCWNGLKRLAGPYMLRVSLSRRNVGTHEFYEDSEAGQAVIGMNVLARMGSFRVEYGGPRRPISIPSVRGGPSMLLEVNDPTDKSNRSVVDAVIDTQGEENLASSDVAAKFNLMFNEQKFDLDLELPHVEGTGVQTYGSQCLRTNRRQGRAQTESPRQCLSFAVLAESPNAATGTVVLGKPFLKLHDSVTFQCGGEGPPVTFNLREPACFRARE